LGAKRPKRLHPDSDEEVATVNATTLKSIPGYALSGAIGMCGAHEAQQTAARKRVLQLAPVSGGVQGIGVRNADLTVDLPTAVSANTSELSPG
jgi:hypothetical protein